MIFISWSNSPKSTYLRSCETDDCDIFGTGCDDVEEELVLSDPSLSDNSESWKETI